MVHLITSTPELSQRLFGVNKNNFNNTPTTTIPITTTTTTAAANNNSNSTLISLQAPTQQTTATKIAAIEFNEALTAHLPTVLGLKIKSNLQQQNNAQIVGQQQQQQQQQQMQQQAQQQQQVTTVPINTNPNSLLKQQLRAGLKELIDVTITNATNNATTNTLSQPNAPSSNANTSHLETQEACSALQSLANVAERQAQNNIQPPSANNLHHQFLLHMAANPILKSSGEFFHQQNALLMREEEHNLELLMDQSDKSDPEMLTLADENAGLDYSTGNETGGGNQTGSNEQLDTSANSGNNNNSGSNNTTPRAKTSAGKPIQRRRIRRKAQSSLDDQAEQLTEMSVRGLDLFRYASINEGVYQCTECAKENMQKTFKNKYSFQRHAFLYHEGKHRKVFPCPLCGKEFSRPDKMKNHMKMTHESFVAKEIQNFNPLNYLITAAGEIQASFTTSSTTTNAQTPSNVVTTPPQPLLNQLQANNPALSIMINNNNNNDNNEEAGLNLTQQQQQQQQQENLNDFNLPKPLKFPTDIEIKNEIVISPSPSPPPLAPQTTFSSNNTSTPISLAETLSMLKTSVQTTSTNNAQLNSQRLEEVK